MEKKLTAAEFIGSVLAIASVLTGLMALLFMLSSLFFGSPSAFAIFVLSVITAVLHAVQIPQRFSMTSALIWLFNSVIWWLILQRG